MSELTELIAQYREAQQELIAAMEADQKTFDEKLAKCKRLRAAINRQCPDSSIDWYEFNLTEQI